MINFAFIFARGGSKGIPGKNKKHIAGKPLIAHSIEGALACSIIDRVFVSTDDKAIAEIAMEYGAEVPFMRPARLATDSAPEWLAWQHAVQYVQDEHGLFDTFISLPATAPCRTTEDILGACELLTEDVDIVVTATESHHNPYFNMLKNSVNAGYELFFSGSEKITQRQDAPQAYNMSTVAYVTRPEFIMKNTSIWDGRMQAHLVSPLNAIDIDDHNDFKLAELVLTDRLQVK